MDFSNVLIRCSSLYCLFTEPKSKADKDAGELSKTAKSHLIEVYASALWDVERDILTKAMKKGVQAEEDGITLLSRVDKTMYEKNKEREANDYITGHPDIIEPNRITDLKLSWDAFTFLPKMMEEMDDMYFYQLQGYMWLFNKQEGRISYALVDTPESIINGEKYRLLKNMDVISELSPEYVDASDRLEKSMKFSHIDPQLRIIHQYCQRNEEIIAKIPEKVEKAREYLSQLYKKHTSR